VDISAGEIGIFFTVLAQIGAGGYWVGKITHAMEANKEDDAKRDKRLDNHAKRVRKLEIETGIGD